MVNRRFTVTMIRDMTGWDSPDEWNLPVYSQDGPPSDHASRDDEVTDIDPEFARCKLDEIFALHEVGRDLLFAGARHDFPEKSDEQLWQIVAERAARRRRGKWGHYEPKP